MSAHFPVNHENNAVVFLKWGGRGGKRLRGWGKESRSFLSTSFWTFLKFHRTTVGPLCQRCTWMCSSPSVTSTHSISTLLRNMAFSPSQGKSSPTRLQGCDNMDFFYYRGAKSNRSPRFASVPRLPLDSNLKPFSEFTGLTYANWNLLNYKILHKMWSCMVYCCSDWAGADNFMGHL